VKLAAGTAELTWGEILGATEYRLYARSAPDAEFRPLYTGPERTFVDHRTSLRACDTLPSARPVSSQPPDLVEYCVTAVSGNGESAHSRIANTDPSSWRNWDPRPGEKFRRVTSFRADTANTAANPDFYYP
jgi:hypothetical protein